MGEVVEYVRTLARARARSAAHDWVDAAALWALVVEANPVHGNHWDRLAEARFALGDFVGALVAYENVAGLGVWDRRETVFPSEVAYRIACCQAQLGDADGAFAALGRALDLGYRDLDRVRGDEHLASLRGDSRFAELPWKTLL
jgi:tetratricopeptide (TPR) repeat protein